MVSEYIDILVEYDTLSGMNPMETHQLIGANPMLVTISSGEYPSRYYHKSNVHQAYHSHPIRAHQ